MTRRNNNRSTYRHETSRAAYLVTLERLNNTTSGTPKYNANVIVLEVFGEPHTGNTYYTPNYTFSGWYRGDEDAVSYIVSCYESEVFERRTRA